MLDSVGVPGWGVIGTAIAAPCTHAAAIMAAPCAHAAATLVERLGRDRATVGILDSRRSGGAA